MRTRPTIAFLAVALAVLTGAAAPAHAAPKVSSGDLVEHADTWDGKRVLFEGEAIGDVMVRGPLAWFHVNDDAYSDRPIPAGGLPQGYNSGHAVLAPAEESARVTTFGSYRARGDIVRVTGIFQAADPRHGGDMLIEAESIQVIERGYPIDRDVPRWKLIVLATLMPVAGGAYLAFRYRFRALPK
ncbi:MAG: hypothetical protein IBX63_09435 [Coriobacteriia bacterium]|nr:hypothetical protein [Coriobacteriia bacterium]